MDDDLEAMRREQLIAEARRLRAGIRKHRDSTGHALCWHHPALWVSCPRRQTRCLRCPRGRSFCGGVCSIANPWIGNCLMRPAQMRRIGHSGSATSRGCGGPPNNRLERAGMTALVASLQQVTEERSAHGAHRQYSRIQPQARSHMPLCGSTRVARLGNISGALPSIPDPLRSIRIPGGSGRKKCSLPSWGITRIESDSQPTKN